MSIQSENFYAKLYESGQAKNLSIAIAIIITIIATIGLIGVILYESYGSDKKRTVINMLITSMCWAIFQGVAFVYIPAIINYLIGPLPKIVCFGSSFARLTIFTNLVLYQDAISIMKYAYIFWLQNPAAFHDNFWCIFINLWVHGCGLISQIAWHLLIPRQPVGYYICSGIDPTEYLKIPLKVYGVLELSSLVVNLYIWVRIKVYKSKRKDTGVRKSLFLGEVEKLSLTNFGIMFTNLMIFVLFIANQVMLNQMDPDKINKFPHSLNVYMTFLIMPGLTVFMSLFMFYFRNPMLRRFLAFEMKDRLGKVIENFQ